MHRVAMLAVLLGVLVWAAPTLAASRVAIVKPEKRDAAIDEATVRLGGELGAAGFEVIVLAAKRGIDARAQVESIVLDPPPFAIISITRTPEGAAADVWVADRLSNKTVVRRIAPGDLRAEAPPRALAIRAVELLRASLLEVQADPQSKLPDDVARWMRAEEPVVPAPAPLPPPAYVPPPPVPLPLPPAMVPPPRMLEPPPIVEPPHTLFGHATVGLAPGLFVGELISVAFAPTLRASAPLPYQFCARFTFAGTLVDSTVDGDAGTASVRQELLLAELGRSFGDADDRFVPLLTIGLGAYRFSAQGRSNIASLDSLGGESWSFAASAGAGLALRVIDPLALTLEAHVVFVVPRASVTIGDETLGPHGLPLFHPTLGMLVSF